MAVSNDGGRSYNNIAEPPGHLVAASPYPYEGGAGPYGVFQPSNMIRGKDGYIYAFIRIDEYRSDQQRICLMRTDDLADPTSWRVWDGSGFTMRLPQPYANPSDTPPHTVLRRH